MATQHAALKRLEAPFDKFIVDGFNFVEPDVRHYFLTHAHSDHTCGLHSSFDLGTIYCSELTARVLRATLGTRQKLLCTIEVGQTVEVEGINVTALDAGHCPGSLMFLFTHLATGRSALHTGDCRASPDIVVAAATAAATAKAQARRGLATTSGGGSGGGSSSGGSTTTSGTTSGSGTNGGSSLVDTLYLDTTYASPRWAFPAQPASLAMLERIVAVERAREPATLFLVGSYQVGKEKAIAAATRASGGRALVPPRRALSLRLCHEWSDAMHTEEDAADVTVHVSPLGGMGQDAHTEMREMIDRSNGRYRAAVYLRPTGWTWTKGMGAAFAKSGFNTGGGIAEGAATDAAPSEPPACADGSSSSASFASAPPLFLKPWAENGGATRVYGVPYSEHSSYTELEHLVSALRPAKIVPTVNADSSTSREKLVQQFAKGMDSSASKRTLDYHFRPKLVVQAGDGGDGGLARPLPRKEDALEGVDVAHQKDLWELLTRGKPPPKPCGANGEAVNTAVNTAVEESSMPPTKRRQLAGDVREARDGDEAVTAGHEAVTLDEISAPEVGTEISEAHAQLCDVLGGSPPAAYVASLLNDSGGDVELACSIHFGANGGVVPSTFYVSASVSSRSSTVGGGGGGAGCGGGGGSTADSLAISLWGARSEAGGDFASKPGPGNGSRSAAPAAALAA